MRHGESVSAFEAAFAERVRARYAIAMTNGTVTLEVALRAMDVRPGDSVQTTPLTMAATTISILNVAATPRYCDVDPDTWLMKMEPGSATYLPVSLYGLHMPGLGSVSIDDAAQTLRPHSGAAFTSYSLQRSKILNTGEGGVLVTDHEHLAVAAREIASLGYRLGSSQSRIDSNAIKSPTFDRHHRYPSMNARMNDVTAALGLERLRTATYELESRRDCAELYKDATDSVEWLTWQHVPDGWRHDYWTFAVACDTPARALALADAVVQYGGERPYPCWKLTFDEPALRHLDPGPAACPIARSLQPRLVQFQCNDLTSAETNARALRQAIEDLS